VAIGGGFIFRNENTQRFDQHASVPVPVPILRSINLVRKVYAKAERRIRMFSINKEPWYRTLNADPVPTEAVKQRNYSNNKYFNITTKESREIAPLSADPVPAEAVEKELPA
jgi:hypothetical protein